MMETEELKIFDDERNQIGTATREEVHRLGYWHESFHCWFISREDDKDYIYLQLRSKEKKDYPNLFDITAAGHLLSHETAADGVREIKEEIGIDISFEELQFLRIIEYSVKKDSFIDKELANVYLYENSYDLKDFMLQKEEVSGMVRAEFPSFKALFLGEREEVHVTGFETIAEGSRNPINRMLTKTEMVPHETSYYQAVIKLIEEKIKQK